MLGAVVVVGALSLLDSDSSNIGNDVSEESSASDSLILP